MLHRPPQYACVALTFVARFTRRTQVLVGEDSEVANRDNPKLPAASGPALRLRIAASSLYAAFQSKEICKRARTRACSRPGRLNSLCC